MEVEVLHQQVSCFLRGFTRIFVRFFAYFILSLGKISDKLTWKAFNGSIPIIIMDVSVGLGSILITMHLSLGTLSILALSKLSRLNSSF